MGDSKKTKREQAFDLYKENSSNIDLVEIARLLDCPPGTVRGWKSKDKWDKKINGTLQEEKVERSNKNAERSNKGGAPPGNKNGVGNKGGAAPRGNKNALKTGEFETIFADTLSDEEKEIYSNLSDNPSLILIEEVRLLKIRQHRMMKRIKDAEAGLDQKEVEQLYELRGRKQYVDSEKGGRKVAVEVPTMIVTERKEKLFRKIEDILLIEDALTRVSAQLSKAVKQLNEIELSEQRLELMRAQTDHTKAQTTKALINKDGDENDGGTVINIIDDVTAQEQEGEMNG